MTVSALLTGGVGPGGSIPLILTMGLRQGAPAPVVIATVESRGWPGKDEYERHRKRHKKLDEARDARNEAKRQEWDELGRQIQSGLDPPAVVEQGAAPVLEREAKAPIAAKPQRPAPDITPVLGAIGEQLAALRVELKDQLDDDDEEEIEFLLLHS